jgi:NitT/TauT family transport system permease protein
MTIFSDSLSSLLKIAAGVSLAAIFSFFAGIGRSLLPKYIKSNWLFLFLCEAPKFPPPIAWIPFVILWLGIGDLPAIAIVFIGAFPPIFTAVFDSAERLPEIYSQTAKTLNLKSVHYLRYVLIPYILPGFFSGLRSGLSMGWMSVIAAEMISGQAGLGYSIQLLRLNLQYSEMILYMVVIGSIGFFLVQISRCLERLFIPWNKGNKNA